MSQTKVEKGSKPFRIGDRKYLKLGEVRIGNDGKDGDDFVKLSDVGTLIPKDAKWDKIHLVGNREGVQVYQRLT